MERIGRYYQRGGDDRVNWVKIGQAQTAKVSREDQADKILKLGIIYTVLGLKGEDEAIVP